VNWYRLFISAALVVVLAWVCSQRIDELLYHFSNQKILQLGDVTRLLPDVKLPTERYVELTGVIGNKGALITGVRPGSFRLGPIQVRHLLGSQIFIEYDQNKLNSQLPTFSRVTLSGRLVDFGPKSELWQVRNFFSGRLSMKISPDARLLIVDEKPWDMWRYPLLFLLCAALALGSIWMAIRKL